VHRDVYASEQEGAVCKDAALVSQGLLTDRMSLPVIGLLVCWESVRVNCSLLTISPQSALQIRGESAAT
jgi:hypothetical protein